MVKLLEISKEKARLPIHRTIEFVEAGWGGVGRKRRVVGVAQIARIEAIE